MFLRLGAALLAVSLAACGPVEATSDTPALKRAARVQQAQEMAAQPPKVTHHTLEHGELLVIETNVVAPGGFSDSQRCFLWRDKELGTASLSCPADSAGDAPPIE